jgi:integrase
LPIRNVTAAHLLAIVQRVESRGAETFAVMLRQWTSAIFRYAVSTLRADTDPAAALKYAIHRPKTKHAKRLSRGEIATFVKALDSDAGYRTTVIALRLMLLTFVRTKELRTAPWKEIDLDRAEWRIAAERMKMREAHTVPLSRQAVALLRELYTFTGGRPFLFPNYRNPGTCMTATTLNRALERMGFNGKDSMGFSAHGFRATASTILNEIGFRPEVIERQLAHAERNKVRASYNQAEYLEERRAMMQQWADITEDMAHVRAGTPKPTLPPPNNPAARGPS